MQLMDCHSVPDAIALLLKDQAKCGEGALLDLTLLLLRVQDGTCAWRIFGQLRLVISLTWLCLASNWLH